MSSLQNNKRSFLSMVIRAEISSDIIDIIRGRNQLNSFKQIIERSSKQIKVVENDGKWFIHGTSFAHVEMCQKKIEEFWEHFDKMAKGSEMIDDLSNRKNIKVDIGKDFYQALMFLEKRKVTNIIGNAKIKFSESSGSLEITGQALDKDIEDRMKKVISDFQSNITMDVIEIQYRQLKEMTRERFIIKLQREYPGVYVYIGEENRAELSFAVYLVSLNSEQIIDAKRGIQDEYLNTSNIAERFTQSKIGYTNERLGEENSSNRSLLNHDRKSYLKKFKTAEGLTICVYMADIRNVPVDCIVNAANGQLMHEEGLAAVIEDAAGRGFNQECHEYVKSYGEIQTGHCCVTSAGNLPYKRVIHAVGPQWSGAKADECCDLLQKTIEQCIQTANAHQMASVAFPSLSAGLYGMPAELCAKCYSVGVMTVSANRTGNWSLREVHFIDIKPDMVFKVQAAFADFFENCSPARQGHLKEQFLSYNSVNQFKGDQTIINKLLTRDNLIKCDAVSKNVITTPLECVRSAAGNDNDDSDEKSLFVINQSPIKPGNMPENINLPATWHVTVRPNLLEIKTDANFKAFVYEREFTKLCIEAVAFGHDIHLEKRSSLIKLIGSKSNFKLKLKQLKVQLPEPTVGTVVMFESIHDTYKQNVFVVFVPAYSDKNDPHVKGKSRDDLCGCYLKLFQEVLYNQSVECLAVSFLKTGHTELKFEDLKDGAEVFLQAVKTFTTQKTPHCSLKQIHLVLKKTTKAFKAIQSVLEQHFKGQDHLSYVSEKGNIKELALIGNQKAGAAKSKEADELGSKSSDDTEIKVKPSDVTEMKAKSSDDTEMKAKSSEDTEMKTKPSDDSKMKAKPLDDTEMKAKSSEDTEMKAKPSDDTEFKAKSSDDTEMKAKSSDETEMKAKSLDDTEMKAKLSEIKTKSSICAICLEEIHDSNRTVLKKCKHEFCKDCIDECFKHKPVCPSCGMVYGIITGNQPPGTMNVVHNPDIHLPGFNKQGHYMISYSLQSGTQTAEHSNPGQNYVGTVRHAYLPANNKGKLVMQLLKIAFDRKLVFTIGHSRTTGAENVVTWNDIHHKTNMSGGPQSFGYPDPEYLDRVLDELAAKGVTESDLK